MNGRFGIFFFIFVSGTEAAGCLKLMHGTVGVEVGRGDTTSCLADWPAQFRRPISIRNGFDSGRDLPRPWNQTLHLAVVVKDNVGVQAFPALELLHKRTKTEEG
jgi:hypothetical protein